MYSGGRIIKDVMRHPLGEENEVKKWRKNVESRPNSGADTHAESTDTLPDEIDPADFFDPEEFGYRRGRSNGR
jgi:hypothetical protein